MTTPSMRWQVSDRADPAAARLADRHYSRKTVGAQQFTPPGRCVVLRTPEADALWVTSWPYARFTRHAWPGAWLCSIFRNESEHLSSELIREALAATRAVWPVPPDLGCITFVDPAKVRPKRDPGRCFLRAGFHRAGHTQGGLVVLQVLPGAMPGPLAASRTQLDLMPLPACVSAGRTS
jgi:hypothetical protein